MNVRLLLMAAVTGGLVLVQSTAGGAGGGKKDEPFPKTKPGPEHELLAKLKGSYETKMKLWMGPGEPKESTAKTKRTMIMDGLFLQENHSGDFLGMPFKGMGIVGYDTLKKKYFMGWIDNFGTSLTVAEGSYDPAAKAWTYVGEEESPQMGKMKMRDVLTMVSGTVQRLEMYRTPVGKDGKEFKLMEIVYTRVPEASIQSPRKKGG
jgi:hypothetical protein